jgi:hypothetical protein
MKHAATPAVERPPHLGRMIMETDIITLPAYWACALINGDESGMSDEEIAEMDTYLADALRDGWQVVSTVDDSERFTWSYDLYGGSCAGGDVLDYVVVR